MYEVPRKSPSIASMLSGTLFLLVAATCSRADIVATDTVEDDSDYTYTFSHTGIVTETRDSGALGLTALAGDKFVNFSDSVAREISGTVRYSSGFGASTLIAPGTYELTVYAGQANVYYTFATFDALLETTAGIELPGKTVLMQYEDPNTLFVGTWVQTVVQYEVPVGHELIGREFTWGFDWTNSLAASPFIGAWDAASVDFRAVPELSSVALWLVSGLVGLGFATWRRRRVVRNT